MSRRESRVSGIGRQTDALLEFENFKKRFLLANKHITKLNSTLSVKIEELNAQISALYVENLRLRSSEIALSAQLKREKEKSRSIMADAEAATMTLMKHLESLRESYKVPSGKFTPRSSPSPPLRTRPLIANSSPAIPRIARAPTIPEIQEVDEQDELVSPRTRRKSSSRLPISSRKHSAPSQVDPDEHPAKHRKKASRRHSGLLNPSRICDSPPPARPESAEFALPPTSASEEPEEGFLIHNDDAHDVEVVKKKKSKRKVRDEDDPLPVMERITSKLKDVTNSAQNCAPLPPLDTNFMTNHESSQTPDLISDTLTSATSMKTTSTRTFLTTPVTAPALIPSVDHYLPTPRGSSSTPPPEPEAPANMVGREKRVRKSVNYAEPKLNTKMRKPDNMLIGKRSSQSAREDSPPPSSSPSPSEQAPSLRRKQKASSVYHEDDVVDVDEDNGDQADAEYGGIAGGTPWVGVSERRRRSALANKTRRNIEDEARRHSLAV